MKVWILASLLSAAVTPLPAAAQQQRADDCQVGNSRQQSCIDASVQPPAPQTATVRPVQRYTLPTATTVHPQDSTRRRSGKRIPDAELIGPRGAL
jgi:hypothetical protein